MQLSQQGSTWLDISIMFTGLGVISESYFLRHAGGCQAKSAGENGFLFSIFSGFSLSSTNPFIVHSFTWVLMYFPEGLLFWLIPSSIPTARSLKRKGKEEKKIPWTSHCWFFWSSSLFANVRFWNHGPLNSQHTSLFKQPLGSFPNPKLLLNINCPGGFVATLFHIH